MTMTRLRMRFAAMVAVAYAIALGAQAQTPHSHEHGFQGAGEWAQVFDNPKRDGWQKPHQVIAALNLGSDAVVADIGAGTGYFSSRFARMLPAGRVYAVDTEPDMVKYLHERAGRENLQNLTPVQAQAADPRLPEKVDLAIFVDVYHHVENREAYLKRLRAALKPGGRIALVDFKMDSPIGPPASARIAPEQVKREFRNAGFMLQREHDFLPYQYFMVFQPGKS